MAKGYTFGQRCGRALLELMGIPARERRDWTKPWKSTKDKRK